MEQLVRLPFGSSLPSASSIASSALDLVIGIADAASEPGESSSKVASAVTQVRPLLEYYIQGDQRRATAASSQVVVSALSQVASALEKVGDVIKSKGRRAGLISRLIQAQAIDVKFRSAVADLAHALAALPWPSLALPVDLERSAKKAAEELQEVELEEMSSTMRKVSLLREELRRDYDERSIRNENIQTILQSIIAELGEEAYKDLVIEDMLELKKDLQNAQRSQDASEEYELLQVVSALRDKYISNRLGKFASEHRSQARQEGRRRMDEEDDDDADADADAASELARPGSSALEPNADLQMEPPEEFLCPITQELMERPYVLLESGITYEFDVICEWLCTEYKFDPQTSNPLFSMLLAPNIALQQQIDAWKAERGLPISQPKQRPWSRGKMASWDYVFIVEPAKEKRKQSQAEEQERETGR